MSVMNEFIDFIVPIKTIKKKYPGDCSRAKYINGYIENMKVVIQESDISVIDLIG